MTSLGNRTEVLPVLSVQNLIHGATQDSAYLTLGEDTHSINRCTIAWIHECCPGVLQVQFWAPTAAGGGVSLVMAFLNGTDVPDLLRLQTFITKFVGSIFSCAANLTVGTEGPLVHMGACIASVIAFWECGKPANHVTHRTAQHSTAQHSTAQHSVKQPAVNCKSTETCCTFKPMCMQIDAQCIYTSPLHLTTSSSVCLLAASISMLISLSASGRADLQSAAHVHHEFHFTAIKLCQRCKHMIGVNTSCNHILMLWHSHILTLLCAGSYNVNGKTLTFGEWMSSWCCCSIFRKERRRYSNGVMEDDSTEPPFHTDADHREFVSAGAAAGLAVGVLCCAVLCCAVPCCAVLCLRWVFCAVLCRAVPCSVCFLSQTMG